MSAFVATSLAGEKSATQDQVVSNAVKYQVGKFVPKDRRVKFVTLIPKGIDLVKRWEEEGLVKRLAEERHARRFLVRGFVVM